MEDAWKLRGGCVQAASAEELHLCAWAVFVHMQPTFIHLWAHSSMPGACSRMDRHADGIRDATYVCLSFSHGGQPAHGHMPHLWLLLGTVCRPVSPYAAYCIPMLELQACVGMPRSQVCVCA